MHSKSGRQPYGWSDFNIMAADDQLDCAALRYPCRSPSTGTCNSAFIDNLLAKIHSLGFSYAKDRLVLTLMRCWQTTLNGMILSIFRESWSSFVDSTRQVDVYPHCAAYLPRRCFKKSLRRHLCLYSLTTPCALSPHVKHPTRRLSHREVPQVLLRLAYHTYCAGRVSITIPLWPHDSTLTRRSVCTYSTRSCSCHEPITARRVWVNIGLDACRIM